MKRYRVIIHRDTHRAAVRSTDRDQPAGACEHRVTATTAATARVLAQAEHEDRCVVRAATMAHCGGR